jgi:hypothetical protein
MDIGGFAEPRKILCQCALPSVKQLSVYPRSAHGEAGIPQQIFAKICPGFDGLLMLELIVCS